MGLERGLSSQGGRSTELDSAEVGEPGVSPETAG